MDGEKVCPDCAEAVKEAARVCRFCGHRFRSSLTALVTTEARGTYARTEPATFAHSKEAWRAPPVSSGRNWWERRFQNPLRAQAVCVLLAAVAVCLGASAYRYIEHQRQLRASAQEEAAFAARTAERKSGLEERLTDRRKGLHCLSPIDGSHPDVVREVKARLNDPDSFQHIKTLVFPGDAMGRHRVLMTYRARNGFGGMVRGRAIAKLNGLSCGAGLESVE